MAVDILPGAYLLLAACMFWLPFRFLMGALLAALVHELCHYLAVRCCGGQVWRIQIGLGGARMDASALPPGAGALCALAGPGGSLLLLILANCFPEVAICGLIQGLYNLLPVWPLDGGRAMGYIFPEAVCRSVEVFFLILLAGGAIWAANQWDLGYGALGLPLMLALQRKLACKEGDFAVQ